MLELLIFAVVVLVAAFLLTLVANALGAPAFVNTILWVLAALIILVHLAPVAHIT